MTAKLVDAFTDTRSNKTRASWAKGAAIIITGFFGGMGGCAMVDQTTNTSKPAGMHPHSGASRR